MKLHRVLQIMLAVLGGILLAKAILPLLIGLFSSPLRFVHRIGVYSQTFFNFPKIYQECLTLKQDSLELGFYKHYISILKEENERLRGLLNMPARENFKQIVADVLVQPQDSVSFFYINRGALDGVKVGFGVIVPGDVMAGRIVKVWPHISKVAYPWDLDFSATVIDERCREEGMLVGTGKNAEMRFIPTTSQIQKGDIIRTSRLSLFFPPGILVGEVKRFVCQSGYIECKAEVEPCIKGTIFYHATVLIPKSNWVNELLSD